VRGVRLDRQLTCAPARSNKSNLDGVHSPYHARDAAARSFLSIAGRLILRNLTDLPTKLPGLLASPLPRAKRCILVAKPRMFRGLHDQADLRFAD
jgi:hypothetical protein